MLKHLLIFALLGLLTLSACVPAAQFLILAPTVVPAFAAAMGIQVLFIRYGLADTMAGVILVHMIPVLPYAVLILAGIFANYDVDYEHQARVLGAGFWAVFWRVTLPMIRPGIIVAALFAFLISWSQYLLPCFSAPLPALWKRCWPGRRASTRLCWPHPRCSLPAALPCRAICARERLNTHEST